MWCVAVYMALYWHSWKACYFLAHLVYYRLYCSFGSRCWPWSCV